jgi:hypothetical protein
MSVENKRPLRWFRLIAGITLIGTPGILDLANGGADGTTNVLRNPTHFHGFEDTLAKVVLSVFPVPVILGTWLIWTLFYPPNSPFRFGLRTLLAFITVVCCVLAWVMAVIRTDWARL